VDRALRSGARRELSRNSPITRPTAPASIRITLAVWISNPATVAFDRKRQDRAKRDQEDRCSDRHRSHLPGTVGNKTMQPARPRFSASDLGNGRGPGQTAAHDALQQLDWAIGYLHGIRKVQIARALARNRSHIRSALMKRDEGPLPTQATNQT
jgi:hypothetical protein